MPFATSTTNDYLQGRTPIVAPSDTGDITVRFKLPLVAGDMTLNNIGNFGILPAGCIPVALVIDSDDLDTNASPTIAWQLGVGNGAVTNNIQSSTSTAISTAAADGGAAWATGVTVSQAGGQAQAFSKALARVQAVGYDRYLALQATTAAATAAAGEIGITLTYRAQ